MKGRCLMQRTSIVLLVIICLSIAIITAAFARIGVWVEKQEMPTARYAMSAAVVDGNIYVVGGYNKGFLKTVEMYDSVSDTWQPKADILQKNLGVAVAAVNGKVYAIGGWNGGGRFLSTVEEYDPATDKWTRKADMPTARNWAATAVVDGIIYAIGGVDATEELTSVVEAYDPVADQWVKKANLPISACCFAAVVDRKIYVMGGFDAADVILSDVYEYDPIIDKWTKKADMPTARVGMSASAVAGKIYAVGGLSSFDPFIKVPTVEIYDPNTDAWQEGVGLPDARGYHVSAVVDGKIYIIGGADTWTNPDGAPASVLSTVEVYDTGLGMQITDISPQEGPVSGGGPITILGNDFLPGVEVTVGGRPLTQLRVMDSLITGVVPPGTEGEQDIEIVVSDFNYSSIIGTFFYSPLSNVVVTRITPTNGKQAGGNIGSIAGSGFLPGARVTIGGNPATDVGVTTTLITITIPPGTEGAKDVVVTNPDGQKDTLRDAYTYNPFPVIEEIKPKYGGPLAGGTEIVITGEHFMTGVVVYIGENPVSSLNLFSPTELRLETPSGTPGTKDVRVVNPDEQEAILEDGFTYNPAPTITSVKPDAGPLEGGKRITITGTGFLPDADVLIGGAEAQVTVSRSNNKIRAKTPPSDAGVRDVVVVNPDGQKATLEDAFTYNPAPVITSVTPNNGRLSGGTSITIQGSGFLPEAKVLISTDTDTLFTVQSVQVVFPTTITAIMPPGKPGSRDVVVRNTDKQQAVLENGFTYNPLPTIISITPNYGSSSGGTKIIIEGTGFLQGAQVMIGDRAATTQVKDDTTIEATAPSNPQGVWDVRITNPDTQEVVMSKGFISVGEMAYNYPNPFRASQGTTFRYVTDKPIQSITVKIFNLAGVPIDVVQQMGYNEVRWHNTDVYAGLYVYVMEVEPESGNVKHFRGVLEVYK